MKKFFNFDVFITPALIKILFPLGIIGNAFLFMNMASTTGQFSHVFGGGVSFIMNIIYFILFCFSVLILRVSLETVMVLFDASKSLKKIANPEATSKESVESLDGLKDLFTNK